MDVDRWGTGGRRDTSPHFSAWGTKPYIGLAVKIKYTSSDINVRLPSGKSLDKKLLGWPQRAT